MHYQPFVSLRLGARSWRKLEFCGGGDICACPGYGNLTLKFISYGFLQDTDQDLMESCPGTGGHGSVCLLECNVCGAESFHSPSSAVVTILPGLCLLGVLCEYWFAHLCILSAHHRCFTARCGTHEPRGVVCGVFHARSWLVGIARSKGYSDPLIWARHESRSSPWLQATEKNDCLRL